MESCNRRRAGARSWLTRAQAGVTAVLKESEIDEDELEDGVCDLDERIQKLDDIQSEYELYFDADHADQLERDVEEANLLRMEAKKVLRKGKKVLRELTDTSHNGDDDEESTHNQSPRNVNVKLPKIDLPKFHGQKRTWLGFWEAFEASVHVRELPNITKFTYLKALLKDNAAKAIEGLALQADNYDTAINILQRRYGRKEALVFEHIQGLLEVSSIKERNNVQALQGLLDEILVHTRSLEKLGISGDQYGVCLTPLILSKLPEETCMEWARNEGKEGDLEYLLEFMKDEIQRLERCELFQSRNEGSSPSPRKNESWPSVAALHSTGRSDQDPGSNNRPRRPSSSCAFCQKAHVSSKCFKYLKMKVHERRDKVREMNLCYRCLDGSHRAYNCRAKCESCYGGHHVTTCLVKEEAKSDKTSGEKKTPETPKNEELQAQAATQSNNSQTTSTTVLPTAKVQVFGKESQKYQFTLLFDTGSDRTYVSSALVKKVKPKWVSSMEVAYAAFGGEESKTKKRNVFSLMLARNDSNDPVQIRAVEIESICKPLQRRTVPLSLVRSWPDLQFADECQDSVLSIDLLVGLDYFWRLMKPTSIPRTLVESPRLMAQDSVFGWVISGSTTETSGFSQEKSSQLLNLADVSESLVRSFWELDSIGIKDSDVDQEGQDPVHKEFTKSIMFDEEDGRYVVQLPWKNGMKSQLLDNYKRAAEHVQRLGKRMDEELTERYNVYFEELERQGMIEECNGTSLERGQGVVYLTHRPVVRESSATTKVRPVFNASLPGPNGVSLNDCLMTGPNLLPLIHEVLIRFRRWPVALSADITKAFLQIKVNEQDQDCTRFLLVKNGKVRIMKFTRVTFGLSCSPFLLNATLSHHLRQQPHSAVVQELMDNLYVDDWLSGANSESKAKEMYDQAKAVLQKAGMTLAKWNCNKKIFENSTCEDTTTSAKILGIQWNVDDDQLEFSGITVPEDVIPTKRFVLSCLARIFDPLGLIAPCVMSLKIMFQDIWRAGLKWDDTLPETLASRFLRWAQDSLVLKSLTIPRYYGNGDQVWNEEEVCLKVYADASPKGYGCCVYVQTPSYTALVMSRARVAPLKTVTLARLELLAGVLAVRNLKFVKEALKLPESVPVECYTDSMITIHWIKSDPARWKQFVRNRVATIQDITDPSKWHHVKSADNPADLLTRGIDAKDLVSGRLAEFWFHGPKGTGQLSKEADAAEGVVRTDLVSVSLAVQSEEEDPTPLVMPTRTFPIGRYGTLQKALRVTGLCLRFVNNLLFKIKKRDENRQFEALSGSELHEAQIRLIKQEQGLAFQSEIACKRQDKDVAKASKLYKLNPLFSKDGLLRKGTRLDKSKLSYNTLYPVILPKGHLSKLYVRFIHQNLCHPGVDTMITTVRHSFWIYGLRSIVKQVKKSCISCQRQDARKFNEAAAPLPVDRVSMAAPFTVCGVDYAGPLYCLDTPEAHYVLLATCAVTRAVHLELVPDQSLPNFILALRRLAARRGLPKIVYSDNAKTFEAAERELIAYFGAPRAPKWKFIAPISPWWGGWWERLVGSMKKGLRKTVGKRSLTKAELETTLFEVEACVNSRPITFVGDDPEYGKPLTPNDFLIGRQSGFDAPLEDTPITPLKLRLREKERLSQLDKCWEVWSTAYLRNLPSCVGKFAHQGTLKEGSLVLIHEDYPTPRLQWPIGVIEKLHVGIDGRCRAVDVRTNKGLRTRDVRRLHVLEMNENVEIDTEDNGQKENVATDNVGNADDETDENDDVGTQVNDVNEDNNDNDVLNADTNLNGVQKQDNSQAPTPRRSRFGRVIKPRAVLDI